VGLSEPDKYDVLRRTLRSRRRDDHAIDLFREAEANLADPRRVDRILLELGKFYNPLTNGPIVDLATRRRIIELLSASRQQEASALLEERLLRYARIAGPAAGPNSTSE
jgi:hypothetical protein